jgi:hypothetical protein
MECISDAYVDERREGIALTHRGLYCNVIGGAIEGLKTALCFLEV